MECTPRSCPNKRPQRLDYSLPLLIAGFSSLSPFRVPGRGRVINKLNIPHQGDRVAIGAPG